MRRSNLSKQERVQLQYQKREQALSGDGIYVYRNRGKGDIVLSKPLKSGKTIITPNEEFQGDSYYMKLVQQGFLTLVAEIQSPYKNSQNEVNMQEKLILDQPDTVTNEGTVEHVVESPKIPVKANESSNGSQPDILLNESPIEDSFHIIQ